MTRSDTPIEARSRHQRRPGRHVGADDCDARDRGAAGKPNSNRPGGADPDQANAEPPARLVGKLAEGVFERDLSPAVQNGLGQALHWGYGGVWGLVYGIVQGSIGLPAALHGTVLGLIVWLVGPLGLVPAMSSPGDCPREPPRLIRSLIFHQVFGWSVALAFSLLTRDD